MSGELNVSAGTLVCTPLKAMPDTTPIPEEQPRADAPAHAESTPDSQPSDPPPTAQPETPELPATPELPQEHVPMLEVHPPHEALRIERRVNINHFAMQTEEFYRFVPKLQNDLAIYQFLKAHPHAPPEQWPGKISGYHMMSRYTDAAGRTA